MAFEDKVAVVTGGGSGIGRACALKLATQGASVVVADLREDLAAQVAKEIEDAGGRSVSVACDVSDEASVEAMASAAQDFGGFDVLIASAGIVIPGRFHEISLADWERLLRINLTGSFLCARAAVRAMLESGGGAIVTIGSVSSVVIGAGGSAASYKVSKGGLLQLTRAIAVEYAHENIRANCICPALVATNILQHAAQDAPTWTTPLGQQARQLKMEPPIERVATPEEVANVAVFCASPDASYVTGSAIMVDGGYTAV